MLDDFLATYDEAFARYDQSRLGGTMKLEQEKTQDTLDDVVVSPHAVFIFADKVVIVAKDGEVIEVER